MVAKPLGRAFDVVFVAVLSVELEAGQVHGRQGDEAFEQRADVPRPLHAPDDPTAMTLLHPLQAAEERRPRLASARR